MLTVGAARSFGGPITFNNSSLNPEGVMDSLAFNDETADVMARVLPLTEITTTCPPSTGACPSQNDGAPTEAVSPMATDFGMGFMPLTEIPPVIPTEITIPWMGNPDPTPEAALDFALEANPAGLGGGGGESLLAEFTGPAVVTDAVAADDPISGAAVPESGSLILVGLGLVAGARYLRRPKVS